MPIMLLAHEQECIAQLLHGIEQVLGELKHLIDAGKLAGSSVRARQFCPIDLSESRHYRNRFSHLKPTPRGK